MKLNKIRISKPLIFILLFLCLTITASAQWGNGSGRLIPSSCWSCPYNPEEYNLRAKLRKLDQVMWLRKQGKDCIADIVEGGAGIILGTSPGYPRRKSNCAGGGGGGGAGTEAAAKATPKFPLTATGFRPVGPATTPKEMVAALPADVSREDRESLAAIYSELLKTYEKALADSGQAKLKNNVAVAYTLLFLSAYTVSHDGEGLPEDKQDEILLEFNDMLAGSGEFKAMTAKEKQQAYETMLITAGFMRALYENGRDEKNAEHLEQAKDLAKTVLKDTFGVSEE